MHDALFALPQVLQTLLGDHTIVAYYGLMARIHSSLCDLPMKDHTQAIQYLIEDSVEQKIVTPGATDFYFKVPEKRLVVLFCHESDIHFRWER